MEYDGKLSYVILHWGKGEKKNRKPGAPQPVDAAYLWSCLLSVRFSFLFLFFPTHLKAASKRVRMRDKGGRGEFHVVVRADRRGFPLSGEEKRRYTIVFKFLCGPVMLHPWYGLSRADRIRHATFPLRPLSLLCFVICWPHGTISEIFAGKIGITTSKCGSDEERAERAAGSS